ncbi:Glycosyltransferase involved in cell wall bisynthesis [Marinitoga hydrogenitolerans DSM 16785]|uniref:Glycosyltransferase involved in cell wall bisynthesis n=1 Tax=Marinitoga hydrogenitolerans (strain DSM 16785 / JCM 12826 / AT1271) TaxID=1122195 RepID=A0A1M4XLH1_MARH1|nr:glycosyltransferase [Marinitoga hydrogenitolerans]SHE94300.1 Glycosyltransferase involved in cell wall bisynthesis [Marinitoga hydrogenitolerans DSM 16785]
MNIGIFSDVYFPQKNGVSTAVKLYKDEMEKLGHNVYLFIPKYSKNYKRNEKNVFEFPAIKFLFEKEQRIALPLSTDIFKIKDLNLDIIHSQDPFSMGIFAEFMSKLLKIKHVGTHHTMYEYYRNYLPLIIRPTLKQTQRMIRNWCLKLDKVISPTNNIKDLLVSYGVPDDHVIVIPTGIDTEKFNKEIIWNLRDEYNILPEEKVLLFVGRLGQEKNIDFLIKVFHKVFHEERNIRFVIIGDGIEKNKLEELVVDLDLHERVIFTGSQPRENVIDAYKQADLFIFASYTETQGLVVLESMAAGTPVVALGKMGVYDLLNHENAGGIMVKDLNEDIFVHEILKVLKDENLYNTLSKNAINFVKENYSIEVSVRKIIDVYKNVLEY